MRMGIPALACFISVVLCKAQTPSGTIAGLVSDPSGGRVTGAKVRLLGESTGLDRNMITSERGDYSFAALLPGEYEIRVEATGFEHVTRRAIVEAGATTSADFTLAFGDVKQSVEVNSAATPQIQFDTHTVGGVITNVQIEGLPLNGRNFLELAKLEPGVQPPSPSNNSRVFVPILGAPGGNTGAGGRGTRVTVDGGSIMAVGSFGAQMGFSQEVVQEFQLSFANFDLSTGITDAGAINVVTRSGGNDFHGAALYFFRDHTLSAYPALSRDPANPDPFFQRSQFGLAGGGPVRRDRVFFFADWERNEQRGVRDTTLLDPEFARFSRITTTPLFGDQLSLRIDARMSDSQTAFVRYSHDGSRTYGPSPSMGNGMMAYPSQWSRQYAWTDQSLIGIASVLSPSLVNEFRFSYFFSSTGEARPEEEDCPGCLGMGSPAINISQSSLYIGSSGTDSNLGRRFHLNDIATWEHSSHRVRFGVDGEYNRGGILAWANEPATLTLWSPAQARQYGLPLPAVFQTVDDILRLPLQNVAISVGDPRVPQQGGGTVRHWPAGRAYAQDSWRLRTGMVVNYGLAWEIDRNLNYDLRKPDLFIPLLGAGGLGPPRKSWTNFSPVVGIAWSPEHGPKTVIRAGAGLYYEPLTSPGPDGERIALGPPGLGRQTSTGSALQNSLPGIPGVPIGAALNFTQPTAFTGADFLAILPSLRAGLVQSLSGSDPALQAVQVTKLLTGGGVYPSDYKIPSALHASIGIQREIAKDFVLSADFVNRHFVHLTLGAVDLNHYNSFVNGIPSPVIPVCTDAQKADPQAICSKGAIGVQEWEGRATYRGVLLRADKRFSHGFQLLASYAYSSNTGTNTGNGFNLYNWLQNAGPLPNDLTHTLNVAGTTKVPWHLEVGLNFAYSSAPPFSAYVGAIDFNGDGNTGDLLPGTTVGAFNRGMERSDLERLVAKFNGNYAGTKDAAGRLIRPLALPGHYSFGDDFQSLDLRVTRSFLFQDRWRLSIVGEVFNLYNAANLNGYSGDLTSTGFGQPTGRATQIFGSGGPRAFQLAVKVSY
ncbi:MAG TPA: carboxypeptidase-like regulatory domain-containing protein [Candidatus Acidoferrales bacterium]|nr:carboxypeptidase-like regulatory domain-containing protein [Candidatus Acidoferrales bacterium]